VRVLDAAGFDTIVVETVGVGQSEVDIVRCADTIVRVSVPGLGDDIQAIKAGVMEIGDIFVVNKADRDGADRVVKEIIVMLEMAVMNRSETRFSGLYEARSRLKGSEVKPDEIKPVNYDTGAYHHIAAQVSSHSNLEIPPVLKTIAETGEGVRELVQKIENHVQDLKTTGFLDLQRKENIAWELKDTLSRQMLKELEKDDASNLLSDLAKSVNEKKTDFYEALNKLKKGAFSKPLKIQTNLEDK
jgi:LAO/AO transport system kinase